MNTGEARKVYNIIHEQKAKRQAAGAGYKGRSDTQHAESSSPDDGLDFMQLIKAHQKHWKSSYVEAYNVICKEFPAKHEAYIQAVNR